MPGLRGAFHYARKHLHVFLYAVCASTRPFRVVFQAICISTRALLVVFRAIYIIPFTSACPGSQVLCARSRTSADATDASACFISAVAIGLRAVAIVHAISPAHSGRNGGTPAGSQ